MLILLVFRAHTHVMLDLCWPRACHSQLAHKRNQHKTPHKKNPLRLELFLQEPHFPRFGALHLGLCRRFKLRPWHRESRGLSGRLRGRGAEPPAGAALAAVRGALPAGVQAGKKSGHQKYATKASCASGSSPSFSFF